MTRLTRWVGRIQAGGFYCLLVLLPFSIAAIEVCFGVLLLTWIVQRCAPSTRTQTLWCQPGVRVAAWWIAGYLAVCLLSILSSTHPQLSWHGFRDKWLEYLLLLVIVADVSRQPRIGRWTIRLLAISAALVGLEAITQEMFGKGLLRGFPLMTYGRMTGPYRNPIDLATYLMVILPVAVAWWSVTRRWIGALLIALLLGCLVRTEATGTWVGLCVGLAVLVMSQRRVRRAGLTVLIALLTSGGVWLHHVGRLRLMLTGADVGTTDRWVMWQAAIGMIRDRPLLGQGLNTFMANYLRYWVGGERMPRYAHNCYLQVAAETGVIGLVCFVGLLAALFWTLAAKLRQIPPDRRQLAWGVLAGLAGFVVQAAVDTNFYSVRQAALFWTLAGLALGLATAAP